MSVSFGRIKAGAFALPLARLVALTPPQDTDLRLAAVILAAFMKLTAVKAGSGWCWLAVKDGKIVVANTANGESPLAYSRM